MEVVYTFDDLQNLVKPILDRYDAESALLFGSYAREEATPESDIDLLVRGGEQFVPTNIFAIADDLYNVSGKRVDVYEESEIREGSELMKRIHADARVIA
ncbi:MULTISPECIES: nucleotidyltransferase family protein [unclassified Adlercreutzia]|uniref:nucleotidyltransferase family protein n=1 Tax=unclassified Adlercreutzia TaxID=2636013 RepID=UPI0013EB4304|nr:MULTISPECIES: nucleotidyltransferase domain-containing protein [unclassified Adlercreutzia]